MASEAVEAPGANAPLSLEPILVDIEGGGHYVGPILTGLLTDLLVGRRPDRFCPEAVEIVAVAAAVAEAKVAAAAATTFVVEGAAAATARR